MTRSSSLGVTLLALSTACGFVSGAAQRRVERATLVTKPARSLTPADSGIPFTRVWIDRSDHRLEAWLVSGADSAEPRAAVFICHGTGETLSDWVQVQRLLRDRGITSFIFDYSGFGNSTGTPSTRALEEDAIAAYDSFTALLPDSVRRVVLGFSLGTGVLLAAYPHLRSRVDGVVLASAFSTARSAARRRHFMAGMLAFVANDSIWNNVAAIRRVKTPLLIAHSDADRTFPLSMAKQLSDASGQPDALHIQHGYRHNALYAEASAVQWQSIVEFILGGAILKSKP